MLVFRGVHVSPCPETGVFSSSSRSFFGGVAAFGRFTVDGGG